MQNTLFLPGPVLSAYSNSVSGLFGYTFFDGLYGPVQIYTETGISLPTSSIFLFPKIIGVVVGTQRRFTQFQKERLAVIGMVHMVREVGWGS